jgi:hypothetical protein
MKCKEAHAYLNQECDHSACPVFEKCRGGAPIHGPRAATAVVPAQKTHNQPAASDPRRPSEIWQASAAKLVATCHERLLATQAALNYLAARGIDQASIKKHILGWLEEENTLHCIFRPRASWGLPPVSNEQGKEKKLWIPRGIIIPTFCGESIDRIRIRRPNGDLRDKNDPKYIAIEGSGNHVTSLNPSSRAQIAVESDLDAILINSHAGDIVGAIPLTSCTVKPWQSNCIASTSCDRAAVILVSLDFDPVTINERTGHAISPGGDNAAYWLARYPQSVRWPVPAGKDPGEAYQKGVDIRAWIIAGLPISLHPPVYPVSATDLAPGKLEVPAVCPAPAASLVHTISARDGREINITDDPAEYSRLVSEKKIVFTGKEIVLVKRAAFSPETAALILDAKELFPGANISAVGELKEVD